MLDANQNPFIFPPKNARGRKDRDFHSNGYTLWKTYGYKYSNVHLVNHESLYINVSGRKGKLLYAACETIAVERNCLSDPSFV